MYTFTTQHSSTLLIWKECIPHDSRGVGDDEIIHAASRQINRGERKTTVYERQTVGCERLTKRDKSKTAETSDVFRPSLKKENLEAWLLDCGRIRVVMSQGAV